MFFALLHRAAPVFPKWARAFALLAVGLAALAGLPNASLAAEYPIGKPHLHKPSRMEIGAVYLQPVTMEPTDMMRSALNSDIHLEADIHALKGNLNGFAEGDWMPYLQVRYRITKVKTGQKDEGHLMAMVANDGPHYGENVKLFGPGKYHVTFFIAPPKSKVFGRHIDKETGVAPWFEPFQVDYDFVFAGIGKKGGY